jgi:uncharacterized protein (TIGR03067 family)
MLPTKLRSAAIGLLALAVLGAGVLTPHARAQGAKGKKTDKERFQGTWEVVSGQRGGEQLPEEITKAVTLTFEGDKVTFKLGDMVKEGTFKLDPTKKPRAIDVTFDDKTGEGIYAFDGKQLKLCVPEPGQGRPSEFKSEAGSQTHLVVLRRAGAGDKKEEKKGDAPAKTTTDVPAKGQTGGKKGDEQALFQGTWRVLSAEKGGEKLPTELLKDVKLVVTGDKIKLTILGEEKEGTFKIDPTKKPKAIDLMAEGKTIKGIYMLSKDTLIVAASEPDQERPKEFEGGAGTQAIRIVFKREQAEKKKDTAPPKTKTGKATLDGSWTVASAVFGGEKLPDEITKTIKVTMAKGKVSMEMMGETKEGTYKADMKKKPATLDVAIDGKEMHGIFTLEGDTLKVCMAEASEGRPSEYKSEAGTQTILMTLKRAAAAPGEGKKGDDEASLREEVQRLRAQLDRTREELEVAERRLAAAREGDGATAGQRRASANNLKQIALAMHNYHDTYKRLPANAIYSKDGKALLSWRVAILPFIEENALYQEFKLDEPWDSEHNKKLLAKMPKIYAPVAGNAPADSTFYQVFTGPDTIFAGMKGSSFARITDGASNTILAAEAGTAVPWTKPDDMPFDAKKDLPKLGGLFRAGFHVAMADGSVRFIRRDFDPQTLRLAIMPNDGQVVDLDKLTAPE